MRFVQLLILVAPLALAACGGTTERTVVVQPQPGQTVIIPAAPSQAHVCPTNTPC